MPTPVKRSALTAVLSPNSPRPVASKFKPPAEPASTTPPSRVDPRPPTLSRSKSAPWASAPSLQAAPMDEDDCSPGRRAMTHDSSTRATSVQAVEFVLRRSAEGVMKLADVVEACSIDKLSLLALCTRTQRIAVGPSPTGNDLELRLRGPAALPNASRGRDGLEPPTPPQVRSAPPKGMRSAIPHGAQPRPRRCHTSASPSRRALDGALAAAASDTTHQAVATGEISADWAVAAAEPSPASATAALAAVVTGAIASADEVSRAASTVAFAPAAAETMPVPTAEPPPPLADASMLPAAGPETIPFRDRLFFRASPSLLSPDTLLCATGISHAQSRAGRQASNRASSPITSRSPQPLSSSAGIAHAPSRAGHRAPYSISNHVPSLTGSPSLQPPSSPAAPPVNSGAADVAAAPSASLRSARPEASDSIQSPVARSPISSSSPLAAARTPAQGGIGRAQPASFSSPDFLGRSLPQPAPFFFSPDLIASSIPRTPQETARETVRALRALSQGPPDTPPPSRLRRNLIMDASHHDPTAPLVFPPPVLALPMESLGSPNEPIEAEQEAVPGSPCAHHDAHSSYAFTPAVSDPTLTPFEGNASPRHSDLAAAPPPSGVRSPMTPDWLLQAAHFLGDAPSPAHRPRSGLAPLSEPEQHAAADLAHHAQISAPATDRAAEINRTTSRLSLAAILVLLAVIGTSALLLVADPSLSVQTSTGGEAAWPKPETVPTCGEPAPALLLFGGDEQSMLRATEGVNGAVFLPGASTAHHLLLSHSEGMAGGMMEAATHATQDEEVGLFSAVTDILDGDLEITDAELPLCDCEVTTVEDSDAAALCRALSNAELAQRPPSSARRPLALAAPAVRMALAPPDTPSPVPMAASSDRRGDMQVLHHAALDWECFAPDVEVLLGALPDALQGDECSPRPQPSSTQAMPMAATFDRLVGPVEVLQSVPLARESYTAGADFPPAAVPDALQGGGCSPRPRNASANTKRAGTFARRIVQSSARSNVHRGARTTADPLPQADLAGHRGALLALFSLCLAVAAGRFFGRALASTTRIGHSATLPPPGANLAARLAAAAKIVLHTIRATAGAILEHARRTAMAYYLSSPVGGAFNAASSMARPSAFAGAPTDGHIGADAVESEPEGERVGEGAFVPTRGEESATHERDNDDFDEDGDGVTDAEGGPRDAEGGRRDAEGGPRGLTGGAGTSSSSLNGNGGASASLAGTEAAAGTAAASRAALRAGGAARRAEASSSGYAASRSRRGTPEWDAENGPTPAPPAQPAVRASRSGAALGPPPVSSSVAPAAEQLGSEQRYLLSPRRDAPGLLVSPVRRSRRQSVLGEGGTRAVPSPHRGGGGTAHSAQAAEAIETRSIVRRRAA